MFKNSGINMVFPENTEVHNRNVARKYIQPLGINYSGAIPKKDSSSLMIREKGKRTPVRNMRS